MSKNEKLIRRFCSKPKDFTYDELRSLLSIWGYKENDSGSGSRVRFYNVETKRILCLHKPHPGNIVKRYILDMVYDQLEEDGLI